ncbi:nuclear transport factor 2 family protein [Flagellimonas halotolerans]|uniref:Nuclear transport factor 2 family protein n=1 Tax=Flagellimonas halotolerans TaxID=3112164 RepID=A0ABU6ITJ1_9FLAO|nr:MULTISPECIES: nuclear transport factor 2 family protein [unclassified Allomuricauda]MEC3966572.1 nuclear transport factor 2 family protein [Muricauda sp. SYSU M86414]MEC4266455.1 nuclear transport factor 2 family protein [Muricauda sp. SYSU M84420]
MRRLLSCAVLFALGTLGYAQGPNPSNGGAENRVKQVIETFFDGFHKQDSTIIKSTVADEIVLQTTGRSHEGKTLFKTEEFSKFLKSIAGIPETTKFEEKLTSFSIQVDRTMANAWVGYEFWLNGKFSHCGINSFQLINFDGEWKIIYLIDTRGKEGCMD